MVYLWQIKLVEKLSKAPIHYGQDCSYETKTAKQLCENFAKEQLF